MTDRPDDYAVGFRRPPKHTRFAKGQSGNPNGRPKGSQNLTSILHKAVREQVLVTVNGREKRISKFEASMLQLMNKAASGDLRAIRDLLGWLMSLANFEEVSQPMPILDENDQATIDSIVRRIRQAESMNDDGDSDDPSIPVHQRES